MNALLDRPSLCLVLYYTSCTKISKKFYLRWMHCWTDHHFPDQQLHWTTPQNRSMALVLYYNLTLKYRERKISYNKISPKNLSQKYAFTYLTIKHPLKCPTQKYSLKYLPLKSPKSTKIFCWSFSSKEYRGDAEMQKAADMADISVLFFPRWC